ncbi:hypothetical protein ERX46_00730 [Brumimicrobium glaciale]|uniref:Uncharacterized protein n=1 Tax=Brumimicrobium glaciale TaxID=200475 RepID=A0A4Q4KTW1_9FLAO|nr:hypothetical protein [Brumimicrobium glaciale]RYM35544.1 hypothetical protein ERX46_00730 [Brumimicrobium glaciale]
MKPYLLLIFLILIGKTVTAGQLDGLAGLDIVVPAVLVSALCILVILVSSLFRFVGQGNKVNIILNIACVVLIISSLISITTLGGGIDPGFLATCWGLILISIVLIFLNFRVGLNRKK